MNYVNLTSDVYCLCNLFQQVDIDEEKRIDVVIADLDDLCQMQSQDTNTTRRAKLYNKFFEFCSFRGIRFILLKASTHILYSESNEFQEIISWIQRTTHYQFEIRGVCHQGFKEEQQIEQFTYFVIFYPPMSDIIFNDFEYSYCEKNYTINNSINKYNYIIDYIFAKIEENLL